MFLNVPIPPGIFPCQIYSMKLVFSKHMKVLFLACALMDGHERKDYLKCLHRLPPQRDLHLCSNISNLNPRN